MGRNGSNRSISPARGRGSPHRKSPSRRERSPPSKHRSSHRGDSPAKERARDRTKRSVSPVPRSPSPRTKRLRRFQEEREDEKAAEERRPRRDEGRSDSPPDRRHRSGRRSRSPRPALDNARAHEGEKGHEKKYEKSNGRGRDRERDGVAVAERRSGRDEGDHRSRNKRGSHSPLPRPRDEAPTSRESEQRNDEDDSVSRMEAAEKALAEKKEKPSFELSGKLAAETNRVRGVTLLFNEPPEAAKPAIRWRLYVFKNGEALNEPLYIHRQSCYLFGRERRVADIPTDHPSCSKQHAIIQFRKVDYEKPDGMFGKQVRPYIMDLGSTNKTFLNDAPIEPQRYYELREQDTIKFGNSSREYVLLHENSAS